MIGRQFRKWLLRHPGKRLPLAQPPLRAAAQGLEEQFADELASFSLLATVALVFPVAVLILGMRDSMRQAQPWPYWLVLVAFGLIGILGCLLIARRRAQSLRNLYLGMLAERYVGQQLEQCRGWQCAVFHDIVADDGKFNIDHVVIGDSGIFVIETKGKSKPLKGDVKIIFDGTCLVFADGSSTTAPLRQVEANAQWVRRLLFQLLRDKPNAICRLTAAEQLPIFPVLVYPGWFIDFSQAYGSRIAVTSDKPLISYIQGRPPILSTSETQELVEVLDGHLRKSQRHLVEDIGS